MWSRKWQLILGTNFSDSRFKMSKCKHLLKTNWVPVLVLLRLQENFAHTLLLWFLDLLNLKYRCNSCNFLRPYLGFWRAECGLRALERDVVLNIAGTDVGNEVKEIHFCPPYILIYPITYLINFAQSSCSVHFYPEFVI